MARIDPAVTWAKVEARLGEERDPVLRRNLETILAHMKAEAAGDITGLLTTLSETDVAYSTYALPDVTELNPVGKDAVRAFYERFIASGATRLQFDVDRLVVDRDCIVTEGVMRMAYPGRTLAARGIEVDDADAFYLYETRMAVLWPFDENGLAHGEHTYTGVDGFAGIAQRKLRPEDIAELEHTG
jgi:hypothetical protein